MHFGSLHDFLAMGGYAPYVWSAFGITFFSLFTLVVSSVRRQRKLFKDAQMKIDRQARIDAAKQMENTL